MADRTTETTVTFRHPFTLAALDETQPAGTYRLVIDEEEILGLSFLAFRRTATMLQIPSIADPAPLHQTFVVDPTELAAVLERDERT